MPDINLSKAVRTNLGSLQSTANLMAKTQERLSTGNKVNSALDNPTNFFTASALNSRAGDLNNLMDSMANGIKTLEAADNGLSAITKNLESMQSTLRQARQDKSFKTASFGVDLSGIATLTGNEKISLSGGQMGDVASAVDLTKTEYRATVTSTNFGDNGDTTADSLLAADETFSINGKDIELASGDDVDAAVEKINAANAGVTASKDSTSGELTLTANTTDGRIVISGANADTGLTDGTTAKTAATVDSTSTYTAANTTLIINDKEIELTTSDTLEDAIAKINDAGAGVQASGMDIGATGTDNAIRLTANDTNTAIKLDTSFFGTAAGTENPVNSAATIVARSVDEIASEINGNADLKGKVRASNDNGKLRIENQSTQELSVRGVSGTGTIDGESTSSSKIGGNEVRADLAKQFNELRDQLDKLADDASFNGINLLRGDNLKITFNETGTSSINIQTKGEKSINAANLNLETTLEAQDLDTDAGIDAFLDQVKGSLNSVRSQASSFGSNLSIVQNRQDFTKSMINTLETGAGNLTLADMNQEAANMMALQTRQSLGSSTLSMANQADQSVLQLLR